MVDTVGVIQGKVPRFFIGYLTEHYYFLVFPVGIVKDYSLLEHALM